MNFPPQIAARTVMAGAQDPAPGEVVLLDPLALPDWDSVVAALPGCSFFHSAEWARTLEESYGFKPVYLVMVKDGNVRALLPLMEVDSWLTGWRGISLPFSDACPALFMEKDHAAELMQETKQQGKARGWKYWEGRDSGLEEEGTESSASFLEHTLPLSGSEEEIFELLKSPVRRAIRKAEKNGVKVEISRSLEDLRTFYTLHCRTRKKHGVPPQPFRFFANFHRNVLARNMGFVVVARLEGRAVAASVFVHFGSKAIYKYGASDERYQSLRAANLVMWWAIRWYARAGVEELNFGRTALRDEGLRRFKLGWGTTERTIRYCRYNFKQERFVAGEERSSDWSRFLCRGLPQWASRVAGGFLYRHAA